MQGKHLYRIWLWGVSVLGVLCFIFANSLMPASESSTESRSVFDILLSVFPEITHRFVRKLAHFAEYALLGAHLSLAPMLLPLRARTVFPLALLFGGAVALVDEWIQSFVPGRGAALADALLDYTGYLTALLLAFVFFFILSKAKRGKMHA